MFFCQWFEPRLPVGVSLQRRALATPQSTAGTNEIMAILIACRQSAEHQMVHRPVNL